MTPTDWLSFLLGIPSPTFGEQALNAAVRERLQTAVPELRWREHADSLILSLPWQVGKPHLALVGHSDTVPEWFQPYQQKGRFYGSGASDMKGALAAFFALLERHGSHLGQHFNLSWILYAREEGTALPDNGLYALMDVFPDYFDSLDLALVGEPTDNTLQIGCVGSLHMRLTVRGQACHSARPWNGVNALYRALPLIQKLAALEPVPQRVFGVDFYDVVQITESQSEPGRTSLPGWWRANVNYRFAPVHTPAQAEADLRRLLTEAGADPAELELIDGVPPGRVIESELFQRVVARLNQPVQAKQAWTDVAQFSARGIPAFNYGPGLTAQAHQRHEYLEHSLLETYTASLESLLLNPL
jgi:succinyl-diaminopimelate desuccinylase